MSTLDSLVTPLLEGTCALFNAVYGLLYAVMVVCQMILVYPNRCGSEGLDLHSKMELVKCFLPFSLRRKYVSCKLCVIRVTRKEERRVGAICLGEEK